MAKDTKLSGGVVPRTEPSEFDKFVGSNLDKAVIIDMSNPGASPAQGVLEIPAHATPQQAAQMRAVHEAIMSGKSFTTVNEPMQTAMAQPPAHMRDAIVQDTGISRAWNPHQPFQPTTRLSDMERTVSADKNPSAILPHARVEVKLNPKEGCSPVLLDCYSLLNDLLVGRWFLPGFPRLQEIETMKARLQNEIELK